jgi:hypothetical protein
MPNDNKNANRDRRGPSDPTRQRSQDAVRHQEDALHHKFHKAPPGSTADEVKQDTQPSEGQPEIPKVGSRDAPGG